jgi:hypothetical protein
MKATEHTDLLRRIGGYWPNQSLSQGETETLRRECSSQRISFEEAEAAIEAMAREGLEFHPKPGQIVHRVFEARGKRRKAVTSCSHCTAGFIATDSDEPGYSAVKPCQFCNEMAWETWQGGGFRPLASIPLIPRLEDVDLGPLQRIREWLKRR